MLKKTELTKLKALFGKDTDKIIEAIKAEDEVDITIPDVPTYSEDQLTERDKNTIAAAKPAILKEGKDTGIEIANKAIVKKYNLGDVDTKDPDKVIAALDLTVSKGDAGLKEQVTLLQTKQTELEGQIEASNKNHKSALFDTDLISNFPTNRKNGMSDKDYLLLVKNNLEFEETADGMVVKKAGQILRDPKTQAAIAPKDAVKSFFEEKKFVGEEQGGGRGGNDNPGGGGSGITKYSQAETQFLKDNPGGNPISPAFQTYLTSVAKATDNFDYDN